MHVLTHAHVSMHVLLGTLVKIKVLYLCLSLSELSCNFNHYAIIVVTKFCVGAPNICGSSVWNLLHVNLTPRILRCPLDLWKIYKPAAFFNIKLIVHHEFLYNNQLDALFILSVLNYNTSACFRWGTQWRSG
jgi:hypothetical protein